MRYALKPYPDMLFEAVSSIEVEVERLAPDALAFTYRLFGNVAALRIPMQAEPARRDRLWETTCFEAFLRPHEEVGYYEFNFSPSAEWAAYRLSGYRSGMTVEPVEPPSIETVPGSEHYELRATLRLPWLKAARLGLSAIIEDQAGRKSFWALAHPPGDPDFHDPACFAAELAAAGRA